MLIKDIKLSNFDKYIREEGTRKSRCQGSVSYSKKVDTLSSEPPVQGQVQKQIGCCCHLLNTYNVSGPVPRVSMCEFLLLPQLSCEAGIVNIHTLLLFY